MKLSAKNVALIAAIALGAVIAAKQFNLPVVSKYL